MKTAVEHTSVWKNANRNYSSDLLAVEEPMQIRLDYGPEASRRSADLAVTMRTPGHDFELAVGFLFTEGIIRASSDVLSVRYCEHIESDEEKENVVRVSIHPDVQFDISQLRRNFFTSSSCGVCGKQSIDQVMYSCSEVSEKTRFMTSAILQAPARLRDSQHVFEYTGGLHACGLFNAEGDLVLVREDIGRHNALDKLIGAALELGIIPLTEYFLMLSGRAGFELVQKAVTAGIPLMAAVGAPSNLAVQLAAKGKMTLLGFVRDDNFNLYTCKNRLIE